MELQIDPAAPRLLHADQALRPSSSVACPCRTQAWACEHRYSVLRLGWLVVGSQTCCLSCSRGHAICTDGTLCEGYGRQLPNGRQSTTAQRGRARTRRSSWRSTPLTRALWLPSRVDRAWAGAALRCAAPGPRVSTALGPAPPCVALGRPCTVRPMLPTACDSITESIHFTPSCPSFLPRGSRNGSLLVKKADRLALIVTSRSRLRDHGWCQISFMRT